MQERLAANRAKLDELLAAREDLKDKLNAEAAEKSELEGTTADLLAAKKAAAEEKAKVEAELKEQVKEKEALAGTLEEAKEQLAALKRRVADKKNELEGLTSEKDASIAQLVGDKEELKAALGKMETELKTVSKTTTSSLEEPDANRISSDTATRMPSLSCSISICPEASSCSRSETRLS